MKRRKHGQNHRQHVGRFRNCWVLPGLTALLFAVFIVTALMYFNERMSDTVSGQWGYTQTPKLMNAPEYSQTQEQLDRVTESDSRSGSGNLQKRRKSTRTRKSSKTDENIWIEPDWTQHSQRRFLPCPKLESAIENLLFKKDKQSDTEAPATHLTMLKTLNRHVMAFNISGCGTYVLKCSCRPPISYWLGRQAWPEIVANVLDADILQHQMSYPTYGIVIPTRLINGSTSVAKSCYYTVNGEKVLIGSIMPFANFKSGVKAWYTDKCSTGDERFLTQLFNLNLLDYLVLNTDRHMPKNWFKDANDNIVAVDNGAWSFHNHTEVCDARRYINPMFEVVRVFKNYDGNCGWPKTVSPICALTGLISHTDSVNRFLQTPPRHWRDDFEKALKKDLWFDVMPKVIAKRTTTRGANLMDNILARKMSSCASHLKAAGVSDESAIDTQQVVDFLFHDISNRYLLAQSTVRKCIENG